VLFTINEIDKNAWKNTEHPVVIEFNTASVLPVSGTITITLPPNYFTGAASPMGTLVPVSGSAVLAASCNLTAAGLTIVCTIAGNPLPAGSQQVTFAAGQLTTGAPRLSVAAGVAVQTSADVISAPSASPAIGGQVTGASLTLAAGDNVAQKSTSGVTTFAFTTASVLPVSGTITITLPPNYFTGAASPMGTLVPVSGSAVLAASCNVTAAGLTIVCTIAGNPLPAGSQQVTFAAGQLTTGAPRLSVAAGVAVQTSADVISAPSASPAIGGQVTGASLTLAAGDNVAQKSTSGVTTFAFTTASVLPVSGTITITLPPNYFTGAASPMGTLVPVSGSAVLAASCNLTAAGLTIVCTIAGNPLPAGSQQVTFAAGHLTFGSPRSSMCSDVQKSFDGFLSTSLDFVSCGFCLPHIGGIVSAHQQIKIHPMDTLSFRTNQFPVVFGFITESLMMANSAITIHLPEQFFQSTTATGTLTYLTSTQMLANNGMCTIDNSKSIIICNIATNPLPAGSQQITFAAGQLTTGAPRLSVAAGVAVQTSADVISAPSASPAIGGQVTGASLTLAAGDNVAQKSTSGVTTFAFTTASVLPVSGTITITLPPNYFTGAASPMGTLVPVSGSAVLAASCNLTAAGLTIVCTIAGNPLPAGSQQVTFAAGQLTTGAPRLSVAAGVAVQTSADVISAPSASPAIGGQVTGASLTLAAGDNVAQKSTSGVTTFAFTTASVLPVNGTITITLPPNYFTGAASPMGTLVPVSGSAVLAASCNVTAAGLTIVCTIAGNPLPAGSQQVTFAAGQLTTGAPRLSVAAGVAVQTSADVISAPSASPAIGGQVTGASLTLAAGDNVAQKSTSGVTTFAFTTASVLPVSGTITITLPPNYFTGAASPMGTLVPVSGSAVLAASCNLTAAGLTIVCTIAGNPLPAGSQQVTFAAGQLTTGAPRLSVAAGVAVQTSADVISAPSASPAIGGQVTGASLTLAAGDNVAQKSTSGVTTFAFTTASVLPVNGTITITLPPNYFTGAASPMGTLVPVSGSAVLAASCNLTAAGLTIVCTIAGNPLPAGSQQVTFAAGQLTTGAPRLSVAAGVAVQTSADVISAPSASPAIGGQVTGASLTLAAGDNVAQKSTSGVTTFAFTTASVLPVNGTITITLPPNYFTGAASPMGTLVPVSGSAVVMNCSLSSYALSIVCFIGVEALLPGLQNILFGIGSFVTGASAMFCPFCGSISTSHDTCVLFSSPQLGGRIQSFAFELLTLSSSIFSNSSSFTTYIDFITFTPLKIESKITISLPQFFFFQINAVNATLESSTGTTTKTQCSSNISIMSIICGVTEDEIPAGLKQVTFAAGQLTTGAPRLSVAAGVAVQTSADVISAPSASPAIGGQVTGASLTLAAGDNVAQKSTSGVTTFAFTTASVLPVSGTITITLPPNYFTGAASPMGTLVPVSGSAVLAASCNVTAAGLTIVCTIAGNPLPAGSQQVTFAAGQLTTGAPRLSVAAGVAVQTSADVISAPSASPAIGGQVTGASLTLAAGDNVAQKSTSGVTTFAFTTASVLPVSGTITITLPPNYFTGAASPMGTLVPVSGSAVLAASCNLTAAGFTIVCTIAGNPLPAGLQNILFSSGSLVVGSALSFVKYFINICTSHDVCNSGDSSYGDVSVSQDSHFRFELSSTCQQLKFRSDDGVCSVGDHTYCNFTIPNGLSHVEFFLSFFADAVSSGCFFKILSLDSHLRASSYPIISVYTQTYITNIHKHHTTYITNIHHKHTSQTYITNIHHKHTSQTFITNIHHKHTSQTYITNIHHKHTSQTYITNIHHKHTSQTYITNIHHKHTSQTYITNIHHKHTSQTYITNIHHKHTSQTYITNIHHKHTSQTYIMFTLTRCFLDVSDRLCSENCQSCENQFFQGSILFTTSINTDSVAGSKCRLLFHDNLSGNSVLTTPFEIFPSRIIATDVPTSIVTTQFNLGSSVFIKFVDSNAQILSSYLGSNVSMSIENCGSAVFSSCGDSFRISSTTCVQLSAPVSAEENIGIADANQAAATFTNFSLSADAKIDGSCTLKFVARSEIFPNRAITTNSSILLYASSLTSSSISYATTGVPISFELEWRDGTQKLNSLTASRAIISLSYCGNSVVNCGSSIQLSSNSCSTYSELGSSTVTGFIIRGDATLNCRLTFIVIENSEQVFTHQDFEVKASKLIVDSFPSIIRVGRSYSFISSARDDAFVRLLSLFGVTVKFKISSCGLGSFDSCGIFVPKFLKNVLLTSRFFRFRFRDDFC
jgi:hypothetical protein